MTWRIIVRPEADSDLLEARAWYDAQQAGLGASFFDAVAATVRRVAEMPLAFPRVYGDTRRAVLQRFPYVVYFQARDEHVLVMAIMHGHRHPDRWQSRG